MGERASPTTSVENLDFFTLPNADAANETVRKTLAAGGQIVNYTPLTESLEDYFLREQEQGEEVQCES